MRIPIINYNRLPIHIKLTIWYALSFMAVMAFSFISFFYVTRTLLLSTVDDTLKTQVDEITNLLGEQSISPASKEFILDTFSITKTNLVLILNHNGEVVAQSQTLPVKKDLLTSLFSDLDQSQTPEYKTVGTTRFYIFPIINNTQYLGTIIVGDSILAISNAFNVLINTLILIFFIFVLPFILISYLEADISLSPLRDVVRKMNSITTQNLFARVDILNPKDEIGEVSTSINDLLDRLQKGFIKERQLIHDVSHQLKTPLTAIRSDIEVAFNKSRSVSEYQQILTDLHNDTTRMHNILKDMVNFAWASSSEQEKHFKTLNLSLILEEGAELITQLAEDKNIKVQIDIQPKIFIKGQKEKIFQALLNILENAIKYTKSKGKIIIKANLDNERARIIIKDTGVGIHKKDLPFIFDRFYRGKTDIEEGSGLGLSIAGALIKAHKGTIEVTSQRNIGTTFIINIPITEIIQPLKIDDKTKKNKKETIINNKKNNSKLKKDDKNFITQFNQNRPHVRTFIKEQMDKQKKK